MQGARGRTVRHSGMGAQGMECARVSSAQASDADTPPLEPRLPDLASSLAPPLDARACNNSSLLPPIVASGNTSLVPPSVAAVASH